MCIWMPFVSTVRCFISLTVPPRCLTATRKQDSPSTKSLKDSPLLADQHLIMMLGCGSQSCVRTGDQADQRGQESSGEGFRISLEHVSAPNNCGIYSSTSVDPDPCRLSKTANSTKPLCRVRKGARSG